jgi:hypothetical protein
MDDCPYCGEEVPAESVKCWKCGAILKDVDEDQMAEFEKEAAIKAGPKHEPCPHCEAPAPIGCHRCGECGRIINELPKGESQDAFKYGTWLVFGGVGFFVVLIIIIAVLLTAGGDEKRNYVVINGSVLSARYSKTRLKSNSAKAAAEWKKKYVNRYVKWSGKVISIDGDVVEFAVTGKGKKAGKAEVQVEFLGSADDFVESLKEGKNVFYDAKLKAYNKEGYLFQLVNGKAVEKP